MKKLLTLFIFVIAFFTLPASNASAKIITQQEGVVIVTKGEIINDDLFIGAQTAEIAGTVNGDVFVGAQTVRISGIINGNLHAGTNTLDLSGTIKGNVYVGAQNISLNNSIIGGSLLVGGATVNIDRTSTIGGAVMAGAGSFSMDSQVKRGVYVGSGNITIGDNTKIGKDFYYASGDTQEMVNISDKAIVLGETHRSEHKTPDNSSFETFRNDMSQRMGGFRIISSIISFAGALVIGLLYFKLFGKHFTQTSETVAKSFWKSMGVGFLVTIAFIPGLIVLFITVIGIPVAGLVILLFSLYSYLAKIIIGLALGGWISKKLNWKVSTHMSFVIGLLIIYLLKGIPVVKVITDMAVYWTGLGALTLGIFSKSNT